MNEHLDDIVIYYNEKVKNTVIMEGILLDSSLFHINEARKLTIDKADLLHAVTAQTPKQRLRSLFNSYKDEETINLSTWFAGYTRGKRIRVYYLKELNTYLFSFS